MSTRCFWAEDFLTASFPYEPVIADRILAAGEKLLLIGPSEAGKSYLVMQWALEFATGGDIFGRDVTRAFRTLLVQAEVMEGEYQDRFRRFVANYGDLNEKRLAIATTEAAKLNTPEGFTLLATMVADVKPEILIFDPLRAFFEGDENDSAIGEQFFQALATLQRAGAAPFTFIGVHHVRKPGSEFGDDSKYAVRGSGIWTDRPSTVLGLSANAAQTEWQLSYLKTRARSTRPGAQRLRVDADTRLFTLMDDDGATVRIERIVAAIGVEIRPWNDVRREVARDCRVSEREVERWAVVAEREGIVEKIADPIHRSRKLIRRKVDGGV